ncbi:NAD(P)-binding protein, partial [Coprinellus micaceus]
MPSLQQARSSNSSSLSALPSIVPTVVVFGATSGIGECIVKLFAQDTKGKARIVLVGRNEEAAKRIIESLPKNESNNEDTEERGNYDFISCDITLMKNIRAFGEELKKKGVQKINYLVLSAGVFSFSGREETEDGLDWKLVSRFYSRFAIIHTLLPMLHEAVAQGEDASILSILGAGQSGKVDFANLGLKSHYAGWKAMIETCGYNDLMVQAYSSRNPRIAFTHIHPGAVDTGVYRFQNPVLNFVVRGLGWPLLRMIMTRPEDCAEWMVYSLLEGARAV